MSSYNVMVIRPIGLLHSAIFNEVSNSLAWALAQLGHRVSITENLCNDLDTNIVFGAHLVTHPNRPLPPQTIIYNLEPPSYPMDNLRSLAKGCRVWDYSTENCAMWKSLGYDVRHVPIGYTPNLSCIPKATTQDIDCLFYGALTGRRGATERMLTACGLRTYFIEGCYGGARDNLISRAKICLNIHRNKPGVFEIVRVSYLFANRKCVVSEPSSDDQDYADLCGAFVNTPYEEIADRCVQLCRTSQEIERMEQAAFDTIRTRDYVNTIAAALR